MVEQTRSRYFNASNPIALVVPDKNILSAPAVEHWLSKHLVRGGAELGVSRKYLIQLCEEERLKEQDLALLVELRQENNAAVPRVAGLLKQGFALEDVALAYRTRDALKIGKEKGHSVSLIQVLRFFQTFVSAEDDGTELAETIDDAHRRLSQLFPWGIDYVGHSVTFLCDCAISMELTQLDAVLDAIEGGICRSLNFHKRP